MDTAILASQLVLAGVFATAGVAKLLDLTGTRAALAGFGVPRRAASVATPLLPLAELAVAVALIPASSARWGAVGAMALLLAFAAGIANAMASGRTPDCHCFGQLHSAPARGATLARNLGLAAVAGFVAGQGPRTEVGDWVSARSPAELVAIGAGAALALLAALSLRLRSENRRLRLELASAHAQVPAEPVEPEGLPVGTLAPNFELADVSGNVRSLESLRAGELPALLVFVDPGCGPCVSLLPHVTRWQAALTDRVAIAVIGEGSAERAQARWGSQAAHLLPDPESRVTRGAYNVLTWPSAIAIGRDGRIASELLYSQDAMEAALRAMLDDELGAPAHRSSGGTVVTPPLEISR